MTFYRNNAEGGGDGVVVTVDNSGDESGDKFGLIGGAPVFSSAAALHGNFGYLLAPAGTAQSWVALTMLGGLKVITSTRIQFRLLGMPGSGGAATLVTWSNTANTGQRAGLRINPAGFLQVTNAASGTVFTSSLALSLNTSYRIEAALNVTTGAMVLRTYLGDSLISIPEMSTDLTGQSFGAPNGVGHVIAGYRTIVVSAGPLHIDDFAVDDTSMTLLGPVGKNEIPFTATFMGSGNVRIAWTHPADAPDGVTIARANGLQSNDGNGRPPHHPAYDPLTIPGTQIIAAHLTASPYTDTGLALGNWTYWVARTSP